MSNQEDRLKKQDRRSRKIQKIIELAYDSLRSHLPYTYLPTTEGKKFHIQCVREYSLMIHLLTDLYDEIQEEK